MLKQLLGWCVALLILAPVGVEAQQASIQASVRVVSRVETQRVLVQDAGPTAGGAVSVTVPSNWLWEVRTGEGSWSAAPVAAGRGGEAQDGAMRIAMEAAAGSGVSYVFAPI